MKKRFSIFCLYLIYWYLLFLLARVAFLLTYLGKTIHLPLSETLETFYFGFKLDIAIVAYIAFLPSLILAISSFTGSKFIKVFYSIYTGLALFFVSLIILGDLFMYRHWGFRIDATPLFYMTNFKAMTASVSTLTVVSGSLAVLFFTGLLFLLYYRFLAKRFDSLEKDIKTLLIFPVTLLLIVVMRGGIGLSSLSTSTAFFSQSPFANHAAINPVWNVGYSLSESDDLQKKYLFYNEGELKKILEPLHSGAQNQVKILRTQHPDIILIITESLTAKAVEATGGRPGIMPQLNQLVKEGVLFDQVYAASDRTDKGMAAVLAGYPSLPGSSPLKYPKLTQKLPGLAGKLNAAGYRSEFYYGGTLMFANYQSFLVQQGFNKMISDKDLPSGDLKSKWGAFDHVVFNRCLHDTPDNDSRFFKTILTLTSHEPFETPVPIVFKGDDDDTKYLNSLHYTDSAIGNFIRQAKTRKWWKNVLVIIVADHGSMRPDNSEMWESTKYHIPMIWLGGALNVNDTVISRMASQTDLAATLLSQLDINTDEFKFSKNILASAYVPYSFFTYTGGFGYQQPGSYLIYNTVTNTYTEPKSKQDPLASKQGKAILQSVYMDFIEKNK